MGHVFMIVPFTLIMIQRKFSLIQRLHIQILIKILILDLYFDVMLLDFINSWSVVVFSRVFPLVAIGAFLYFNLTLSPLIAFVIIIRLLFAKFFGLEVASKGLISLVFFTK
jgi:hypothetical protein